MSLESAIAENTAALAKLSALIAELTARPPIPDAPTATVAPAASAPRKTKAEPQGEAPAPTAAAPAASAPTAEAAPAAAPSQSADAPAITYDQLKPKIVALAKRDRAAAEQLLARFGAKVGTDLKPEQYSDVLAAFEEALS